MSQEGSLTTRLILARHGEVDERWRGTIYGRLDVELSAKGLEQSSRMADALAERVIDRVVSSGLQRAEAAAALIRAGREGLVRTDDERFLELDRGAWAGRRIDELAESDPDGLRRWQAARGACQAPGGESPEDVAVRTIPAFADWAERGAGGTIVIVAHLWVVRSAVAWALGLPMDRSPQIGWPPGGVCELDWPVRSGPAEPGLAGPDRAGPDRARPRLVQLGV